MSKRLPQNAQAADQLHYVKLSWVAYVFNVDSRTIHRLRKRGLLPGARLVGLRTWVMPESEFLKLKNEGLPYNKGRLKPLHP